MGLYTYLGVPNPFRSFANAPINRKEEDGNSDSNKETAHLRRAGEAGVGR